MAERDVPHGGAGLTELCDWLLERTGAQPVTIAVAETATHPIFLFNSKLIAYGE